MHCVETCMFANCTHPRCRAAFLLHQYICVCELLDPNETEKVLAAEKRKRYERVREVFEKRVRAS